MQSNNEALKSLRIPDLDCEENDLLDYQKRFFNFEAVYRCAVMARMARNVHYYLGNQWIDLDREITIDGVRGYVFKQVFTENEMPKPVTNKIAPAVEIEFASLSKRELVPRVPPDSKDPKVVAAAKISGEVLTARLQANNWPAVRDSFYFWTIITGTCGLHSWWDTPTTKLTTVAAPNAMCCEGCGAKVASPMVSRGLMAENPNYSYTGPAEMDEDGDECCHMLKCPCCNGGMAPYKPTPIEAERGLDVFKRPMGARVPTGNTMLEVVNPFELFPQNSGVGVDPHASRVIGRACVRDLDWISERYPEIADEITPEEPTELMRYHPQLGDWAFIGRFNPSLDSNVYDCHTRVYEVLVEPGYRHPAGAHLVVCGDKVAHWGPLYDEAETPSSILRFPKSKITCARFSIRPGEFWGKSLVDDLISPQNRINGIDSQTIEARVRMGSPNLLVADDQDLTGPEWFEDYGGGKIMRYTRSPLDPGSKPEVFGSILMPAGVFEERAACLADMQAISGPQDIEVGEAPRNISTTSGLQMLGESAERKRAPRERAITECFEQMWEHQLELICAYRAEPDEYDVQKDDDSWEKKQFTADSLLGQTRVKIEKQGYVDKSLYQREAVREAQADGLYRLDSQASIKRVLEHRGLPTDVNEDLNLQVDRANLQWTDFMDFGVVPVVDQSMDDPQIHFAVLSTFILGNKGRELEQQFKWPITLKQIAGWEDAFQRMEQMEQMVLQFYGGRIPQEQADQMYQQAYVNYQKQVELAAYQQNAAEESLSVEGAAPPPMPMIPQPPPKPVFPPAAIEDKILMTWIQMIVQATPPTQGVDQLGQPVEVPAQPPEGDMLKWLQFRSVIEAYRQLTYRNAQMQQMQQQPPQQPPQSPGENPPNPQSPPAAPGQ